jgi:hypothetical protein
MDIQIFFCLFKFLAGMPAGLTGRHARLAD